MTMRGSKILFLASWVILLVVAAAITVLSAQSLRIAYTNKPDSLATGYTLTQIEDQGGDEAVKAFRGRRATAATWALGYGLLAFAVILIPYRRGERWAWWALLLSLTLSQLLSLLRAIALATTAGLGAPGIVLALALLALLAGVPRMFQKSSTPPL
jgi:hypothetical protein